MSIMKLGALGEFFGVFALVATLIYLAIQVRQNTRHVRAHMVSDQLLASMDNELAMISPEPAEVLRKAVEDPSRFGYADFRVLHAFLTSRLELWIRRYRLEQLGLYDSSWRSIVQSSAGWFFANSIARSWFEEMGPRYYPADFVKAIQDQLEREPAEQSLDVWHRIQAKLQTESDTQEEQ